MRVDRFIIEPDFAEIKNRDEYVIGFKLKSTIYDRVKKRKIIEINTGNEKLNDELAEAVLTMLNIKWGEFEDD